MGARALERVRRDFTFECFSRNLNQAIGSLLPQSEPHLLSQTNVTRTTRGPA